MRQRLSQIEAEQASDQRLEDAQSSLDKSFYDLQTNAAERTRLLDSNRHLLDLQSDLDDLEQWLSEKEQLASSGERGQNLEMCESIRARFERFSEDTLSVGRERVTAFNDKSDRLISELHTDSPAIDKAKNRVNDAWENLKEQLQTRMDLLNAAYDLHQFIHFTKQVLQEIEDKRNSMSEELGRDTHSVAALQRRHEDFCQQLKVIESQVETVRVRAGNLLSLYAGQQAADIEKREADVLTAWNNLQAMSDTRTGKLECTSRLFLFFSMARDLLFWIGENFRAMNTGEKAKNVAGVEALIANHKELQRLMEMRKGDVEKCEALGESLLAEEHYASDDVRKKLEELREERGKLSRRWQERWDNLQIGE